jgi:hypothetical protein
MMYMFGVGKAAGRGKLGDEEKPHDLYSSCGVHFTEGASCTGRVTACLTVAGEYHRYVLLGGWTGGGAALGHNERHFNSHQLIFALGTERLHCLAAAEQLHVTQVNFRRQTGRAMADAVRRRPLTGRSGFQPAPVHVKFLVDKVAL